MSGWFSPYAPTVVAYGLSGVSGVLPAAPLDDDAWHMLLGDAIEQRMTGHLARAVDDAAFTTTDAQREAVFFAHERALATDLLLERELVVVVRRLQAAGLEYRALKGAMLADLAYPDPGLRSFGDVDLLVRSQDYDAVIEHLCSYGAARRFAEPRRAFDRRFGKGVCLTTDDGFELDVHRTLVAGPFGLALDLDDLFVAPLQLALGGTTVRGLGREARFLHACFRVSLGSVQPRLVAMRDVAQLLLHDDLDAARVLDIATHWHCRVVVQRALMLTWQHLGLADQSELLDRVRRYRPDAFEVRSLAAYVGPRGGYAAQASTGLAAVRGFRAKVAYANALLLPNAEYLRARDRSYARRWRRAVRLWRDSRNNVEAHHPTGPEVLTNRREADR